MSIKRVLLILGLAVGLAILGLIVWLVSGPESGVKMANEMDPYALDYLAKHQILNSSERLVCYYDATVSMDGSESAIVTTERLIYHKDGRTTALALTDVTDIQHHYESLVGDVIVATSSSGESMKIEVAPLNGGETFLAALRNVLKQATGGESETSPAGQ
jgi:hypothetical protein